MVKLVWLMAHYCTSEADGDSTSLATLWNPDKLKDKEGFSNKNYLEVILEDCRIGLKWCLVNNYAPNSRNARK